MLLREVEEKDYLSVAKIYNYYIRNTVVSFEETEVCPEEIAARVFKVTSAGFCWIVIEKDNDVVGYAYASKWSDRAAYRYTAEVSVYLDHQAIGTGLGSKLYEELFSRLRKKSIHVVIGGISLPNDHSINLHEKFGMRKVAHYSEVGFKFGKWVDVGYWQKQLST